MMLRSGLCRGHTITFRTSCSSLCRRYVLMTLAVCMESFCCRPIIRLPDDTAWWTSIRLYFSAPRTPLILTKSLFAERFKEHPPCFPVARNNNYYSTLNYSNSGKTRINIIYNTFTITLQLATCIFLGLTEHWEHQGGRVFIFTQYLETSVPFKPILSIITPSSITSYERIVQRINCKSLTVQMLLCVWTCSTGLSQWIQWLLTDFAVLALELRRYGRDHDTHTVLRYWCL